MNWNQQETFRLLRGAPGTQYQEANDDIKAQMRDWICDMLQKNVLTVTFVKADGTVRDMRCTLRTDLLGALVPTTGGVKESKAVGDQPRSHSIRVFDMDKQQWRSFRFDRLHKITVSLLE